MEFKNHKILWISLLIVVILLLSFFSFRYIQSTKRKSYIQGGNDAINQIIVLAKESGGITLKENNDSTIALALYKKELPETTPEEPLEEDNSATENTTLDNLTETNSSA